jgi:hypothetical protein
MSLLSSLAHGVSSVGSAILPFDPTPGFNLTTSTAGIPFIGHSGAAPSPAPTGTNSADTAGTGLQDALSVLGAGSTYGSGGSTAPVSNWTANDQAAYDQSVATANAGLGRLPNQLGIAQGNVNAQYGQQYNGLQSGLKSAQNSYEQGTTQNQQQHLTDSNSINSQASHSLHSLLRLLGGLGAGGGSEAKYLIPGAVGQQASQQLGKAGTVYAQNAQSLDQNLNDYKNKEQTQEQQLNDWKSGQLNQVQSQSDSNKQSLLNTLATLAAKRAQALGGSGAAEQQPYIDQINQLSNEIDNLGRFNPTWDGSVPVYNAPTLGNFQLAPAEQARIQGQAEQAGSNTPYLSLLLGQKDRQQQF